MIGITACGVSDRDPPSEPTDTGGEPTNATTGDLKTEEGTESDESTDLPGPSYAEITDRVIYLFVGEKYPLRYSAHTENGEGDPAAIEWTASNDCVTVKDGTVRGKKEGFSIVSGGGESQCVVRVVGDDMPVIRVNTGGTAITSKDTYVPCLVTLESDNDDLCFQRVSAGIRLRGNSTRTRPKKPYRIQFDSKRNLLGLNDGAECRSWVLLAEYYDDSLIRNSSAMTFASAILNEYSSDWRYVRLELNGTDMGVYLLAEQSQIHPDRINIEEAGEESSSNESGYLFEIDASSNPPDFYLEYGDYEIYNFLGDRYTMKANDSQRTALFYSVKNNGLRAGQRLFAEKYLKGVFEIIYRATYEGEAYTFNVSYDLIKSDEMTPREAIEAVIDVDSVARKYIHSEIFCNGDEHKKSFFMYVDLSREGTGLLTFSCPWDFDTAFVHWNSVNYRETDVHYACTRNLWYVMMMRNDWFREYVITLWDALYAETNGYRNALYMIRDIQSIYQGDFQFDANKWNREEDHQEQITLTYRWLVDRIAWLNENIAREPQ
jgi:hypothetical protein